MKLPHLKTILMIPVVLFVVFYLFGVFIVQGDDRTVEVIENAPSKSINIAIFGASGTAGDGILKAALASSDIDKVHVITRRVTPRMEEGIKTGKILLTIHQDYLDYSAMIGKLSDIDTVYWAIGISSLGMDEKTYGLIHVDFPMQFVAAWSEVNRSNALSFQFISSSDISEDSTTMWVRQKIRAEKLLFSFADKNQMNVIAHRPDYIGATEEQAELLQNMLYWFFAPIGAAIRAEQIGQAMLEVTARGKDFTNGDKLYTGKMIRYSDAYEKRQ